MKSNEESLQKIFSVIEFIGEKEKALSIQEISIELELSTATVYRILTGLKELGYVGQLPNKQYYLTYKLYEISSDIINRDGAIDRLAPIMNYFSRYYSCEVGLTAFDTSSIIHVITVGESIDFGPVVPLPGHTSPVHCTAAGKLFLAQMERETLENWVATACVVPYTRLTIIDREKLLQEVEKTRRQGYGVAVGEYRDMLASVAFPIHENGRHITGTFNLNFSVEEFSKRMSEEFVCEVRESIKRFGL